MVTTAKLTTAQDLLDLPDDGFRYVLIRGELIQMPPVGRIHGRRQARIGFRFQGYADEFGGEVTADSGYTLASDPDTVLAPDIAYVRPERVPPEDETNYPAIAPDVALEINSPSSRPGERQRKLQAYREAGTRLVLFVDEVRHTIAVEHLDGRSEVLGRGDFFDGGEVMPGFRVPVSDFFR